MQVSKLLMIQPVNFRFNPETAVNNSFQKNIDVENVHEKALEEFNGLVNILRENKIDVTVEKDNEDADTPDSIFPNNWISFHEDNSIFLYPMFATNRRLERHGDILKTIKEKFRPVKIHDLSHFENNDLFLEGTGSMVLDRGNHIAYATVSPRTDVEILHEFCKISHYIPVSFLSRDRHGNTIYHSNVMMCIGEGFAVICLEAIENKNEREKIRLLLIKTEKEIIDISFDQLSCFAGNMIQVKNTEGELLLAMSTQAYNCLKPEQVKNLEKYSRLIHSPLDTIEACGGGSARCMVAEIFNDMN